MLLEVSNGHIQMNKVMANRPEMAVDMESIASCADEKALSVKEIELKRKYASDRAALSMIDEGILNHYRKLKSQLVESKTQ